MKNLNFALILVFILSSCAEEKNCQKFKTGEFMYESGQGPLEIVRTETHQNEINPNNGIDVYSTVEWISDCQYVLTYEKITNHPDDDVGSLIGQKVYVEILETKENRYKARAKNDRMDQVFTFFKVN